MDKDFDVKLYWALKTLTNIYLYSYTSIKEKEDAGAILAAYYSSIRATEDDALAHTEAADLTLITC